MAKPIKRPELLARIDALLRRSSKGTSNRSLLEFSPFRFDVERRIVFRNEEEITLSQREYELALFLFRNNGRLLSRKYLLETVWGTSSDLATRTIDAHVSKLRRKLNISAENHWRLSSVYQQGYRLERLDAV
jgi:DNA-binding response OmpR family regulator